jgi:hypothetical protein
MGVFKDTYILTKCNQNENLAEAYKLLFEITSDLKELVKDNYSDKYWNAFFEYDYQLFDSSCKLTLSVTDPIRPDDANKPPQVALKVVIKIFIKQSSSGTVYRTEYDITSVPRNTRTVDYVDSSSLKLNDKYVRNILDDIQIIWEKYRDLTK